MILTKDVVPRFCFTVFFRSTRTNMIGKYVNFELSNSGFWPEGKIAMNSLEITRVIFALLTVIGMIGLCAVIAKKTGLAKKSFMLARNKRLSVVETLPLDTRRKVAIIRVDGSEHLVVINPTCVNVIERHLTPAISPGTLNNPHDQDAAPAFDDALHTLKTVSKIAPSVDAYDFDAKIMTTA